jgi:tetratricopeptide (TPR) repeat protein
MVTPEERPLLPRFADATVKIRAGSPDALAVLDQLVTSLPRPTPFRGMVQLARVTALVQLDRHDDAFQPIEEAIRLLPEHAIPKLIGAEIYTYSTNPSRAADLWLTASREDPEAARQINDYHVKSLLGRLEDEGDDRRADLVSNRLVEIGYAGGLTKDRSARALSVIQSKIKAADVTGAVALVPALVTPGHFVSLLVDKRYSKLWPAIEEWAGTRLEKQWPVYLATLDREWEASRSLDAAAAYANALVDVNDHAAVVAKFMPLLAPEKLLPSDADAEYLAPIIAGALAKMGRANEGIELLRRLLLVWPPATDARGLNISANLARQQLFDSRTEDALKSITQVLADAAARGPLINRSALAAMHLVKACALHKLGRTAELTDSKAVIIANQIGSPGPYIAMLACTNDRPSAKAFLLARLNDENRRGFALQYLQPTEEEFQQPYRKALQPFQDGLRRDPELLKLATRYGQILSFPVSGRLPEPDATAERSRKTR